MEIRLMLALPRDRSTVPLTRRVLDSALGVLSVSKDCRADIGLAVGEACANAVQHAQTGADYHVTVTIHDDRCVIDVVDEGVGMDGGGQLNDADHDYGFGMTDQDLELDPDQVPEAGPDAETGRGLRIIQALADVVELRRRQPRGVALRIVKMLTWHTPATV